MGEWTYWKITQQYIQVKLEEYALIQTSMTSLKGNNESINNHLKITGVNTRFFPHWIPWERQFNDQSPYQELSSISIAGKNKLYKEPMHIGSTVYLIF